MHPGLFRSRVGSRIVSRRRGGRDLARRLDCGGCGRHSRLRRFGVSDQHSRRFRRDGRHAYYRVDPDGLAPLVNWIDRYRNFWPERIEKLKDVLKRMDQ